MSKVVIVTDSTSDIPEELLSQYGIHVVPLKVMFGDDAFLDGVEITSAEFYDRLGRSAELPKTSQPSPNDFVLKYEQIVKLHPGSPIISIHLSSGMSGTYQSATIAVSLLESDADITVVDSKSASYGFGLLVVRAAQLAAEGKSRDEILQSVEELRQQRGLYFVVDTLENLQKGGRIGKAAAIVGTLLNIKPILSIDNEGIIYSVDKVRGHKKAMARVVDKFFEEFGGRKVNVGIGHTANPSSADELLKVLRERFDIGEVVYSHIGAVVGSHVGFGTLAVYIWPN